MRRSGPAVPVSAGPDVLHGAAGSPVAPNREKQLLVGNGGETGPAYGAAGLTGDAMGSATMIKRCVLWASGAQVTSVRRS